MKTNEAPEKIYLVTDPVWGSMSINYNRNDTNNIEYTRTDAFIDRACEWLEDHIYEYLKINRTFNEPDYDPKLIRDFSNNLKGK